jgi:hypothetical protein
MCSLGGISSKHPFLPRLVEFQYEALLEIPVSLLFSRLHPTISIEIANRFLALQTRQRINQSPDSHSGLVTS